MAVQEQEFDESTEQRNVARTKQRRRVFNSTTERSAQKSRHLLLLHDSDSETDQEIESPNTRGVLRSPAPIGPSFEEIMSKLEIVQQRSSLPASPRSTLRSSRHSDSITDMSIPKRWRHSREIPDTPKTLPSLPTTSPRYSFSSHNEQRHHSLKASTSTTLNFKATPTSTRFSSSTTSLPESEGLDANSVKELKRLRQRQQILREMVATERSFAHDMSIVVQEYQQKTASCPKFSADDCRLIFGGVGPVMDFSSEFGADLEVATRPVLQSEAASLADMQYLDDRTTVGAVFAQNMSRLGKVYARYCSNQEKAANCLQKLSQDSAVQSWLADRYPVDRTTAWDLSSLLIKPVQRVLKYPLLLGTLLEATPRDHPEYFSIELALKEMLYTAENINKVKKRSDLVDSISSADKKQNPIFKTFSRSAAKFRLKTGLDDHEDVTDALCNSLIASFRAQQAMLEALKSEIQDWLIAMKSGLHYHAMLASSFQNITDCATTTPSEQLPVVDWINYTQALSDLQQFDFLELTHTLERQIFRPLAILQNSFDRPSRILDERDIRAEIIMRDNASRVPEQSGNANADDFIQLNITLREELPIFLSTTERALRIIILGLTEVQKNWLHSWTSRLTPVIDARQDPGNILQHFRDRNTILQVHLSDIGLTNGRLTMFNRQDDGCYRLSDDGSSNSDAISTKHSYGSRSTLRNRALSAANSATISLKQISSQIRSPSGTTTPTRSRSSLPIFDGR